VVHTLLFHDLVTAPPWETGFGIYWLRLYADGATRVAVVTEVPGNHGRSVLNATEDLVSESERRSVGDDSPLTTYLVMPSGFTGGPRMAWRVVAEPKLEWQDVDVADIERAVGQRLAPLPGHSALLERVLALGGDAQDTVNELIFSVMRVAELPPPHRPSGCARYDRLRSMEADAGEEAAPQEVGARFIGSLTPADRASCRFHADDWQSVADESVRILGATVSGGRDEMAQRARQAALGTAERRWLLSLFDSPVDVRGGGYTDGQHRGCALRFSGAKAAAVVTGYRTTKVEPMVWVYGGDA
jgi:hypothetical protein